MVTNKTLIAFNNWLSIKYGNFEVASFQDSASAPRYETFLDEVNLPINLQSCLIIEWLDEIGLTEIGGHSIGDIIYMELRNNKDYFGSISKAIEIADEFYNHSH